jgi:hypothetical protein
MPVTAVEAPIQVDHTQVSNYGRAPGHQAEYSASSGKLSLMNTDDANRTNYDRFP